MDQAQLTIVIPVYNRATIVERTLASVAAQTLRPLAVVLVDKNSTDDTLAVLRRWAEANSAPDFAVEVISEPRPGAANARNAGLARVTTPWTMFFDSDDIMLPDHCASALATAAANPAAQIIGWDSMVNFADGGKLRLLFTERNLLFNNLFHGVMATQMYMARTDLFRSAGGWNGQVCIYDDIELGVRLLNLRPIVAKRRCPICVQIYQQEDSISNADAGFQACEVGLNEIEHHLPLKRRHWADLQRIAKLAVWGRSLPDARRIADEVLAKQPPVRRLLWRLYYSYAAHGGRGLNILVKLLSL